ACAAIARLGREETDRIEVLRLGPVADLAPLLRRALPGLTTAQELALLERAGGNPRLLDELLRYALTQRGRALFVGRDPGGPLTGRGLTELPSRGSRLEEIVWQRMDVWPDGVHRAHAREALEGSEFEAALVANSDGACE